MGKKKTIHWKLNTVQTAGNFIGAYLTYLYFTYVGPELDTNMDGDLFYVRLSFIIGTLILLTAGSLGFRRWYRPLYAVIDGQVSINDPDESTSLKIKKRALHFAPLTALFTLLLWAAAGFIFGLLIPAALHVFFHLPLITVTQALKRIFGITFVGGTITTLFIYFSLENLWRQEIPRFFPDGDLSRFRDAFKLTVKARLMIAFLMVSVLPLMLLGVTAYRKISATLFSDRIMGEQIVSGLLLHVLFITLIGVIAAIALSVLVSKSVSAPLEELETAMKTVGKGNFDARINVVSNDEIGAVGEGFNLMIKDLKESVYMKESFGRYVSQEIRDRIMEGGVRLDGEMMRATLLFSDLRDFTPFVESNHPKRVISVMNQYFTEMTAAIKTYRGLILQYVGDEIEAVFGAPVGDDNHPDMAVKAALEMRKRLHLLNINLKKQGIAPLRNGIGIHTGAVLAGIIGSKERSSYALVGDTVNLASRIEGLTKTFSCDIIFSRTTHDLLTGSYEAEQLPPTAVKGKSKEITVYKLLGDGNGDG